MKILERVHTYLDFQRMPNKRKCWLICNSCHYRWEDIETEYVHMVYNDGTRFICDECAEEIKNNSSNT